MSQFRNRLALVASPSLRISAGHVAAVTTALIATLALLSPMAATAEAQNLAAYETPLHLPANRFEFVASGGAQAPAKPLAVHNGGAARLTDVRLTRLVYGDSSRGAKWLVALPRQQSVAPDELATVGTLCIDATGLAAGTYRATAAVGAREIPEPVAITVTLVVTEAGARSRNAAARCGTAAAK